MDIKAPVCPERDLTGWLVQVEQDYYIEDGCASAIDGKPLYIHPRENAAASPGN